MPGKLSSLSALSWSERRVLLQAVLLLPLFWAGLRALGLSRVHRWVARSAAPGKAFRPDLEPARIGALVNVAGAHLPLPSTCLSRSLLLTWLLGRRGVRAKLRIGVRIVEGGIDSHAWVEHDGEPINEAPGVSERFAVFDQPLLPVSGSPS